MEHITVVNSTLERALCVPVHLYRRHYEFFRGWTMAKDRITPEETYKRVDELRERVTLGYDAGLLVGRATTYMALIYLNAELKLGDELFQAICHEYS